MVRSGHRLNVKRLESKINDTVANNSNDKVKLHALRTSLESKMKAIQQVDKEIFDNLTDEGEIQKDMEDAAQQEEYMFELMAKLDSVLDVKKVKSGEVKVKNQRSMGSRSSSSDEESQEVERVRVKLPEYKIPHFYGDPVEWRAFWDQFRASIHENKKLGTIHKYNYLRSYLHDSAADCVNGLTLTEGNYKVAVDIIQVGPLLLWRTGGRY